MEHSFPLLLSFLSLSLFILTLHFSRHAKTMLNKSLPPGPKPWPILGNILHLTDKPHRAFASLSTRHGPLMSLHLGAIRTVVVSSSVVAKEMLTKHDLAMSDRHVPDAARALNHDRHSMGWLPVSPKWRSLRKLASVRLFNAKSLNSSEEIREKKVFELLEHVGTCSRGGLAVDIGGIGFTTTLNLLSSTFFSADVAGYDSSSARDLKDVVWSVVECLGKPNLADFFPGIRWFDPSRMRREITTHFSKFFDLFDDVIEHRMCDDLADSCADKDVLDTLLRINKEEGSELSFDDIKHFLLDFFTAGTETTSSTLEWAMTELLRNPSKMKKAQAELDTILTSQSQVQESDIERLPYLQAIVKETYRLHPPEPLLVPHKAKDDVELCGYLIPKNTQVLVNTWAIGHDPMIWKNPSEFSPERFLERVDIDVKGLNFELIPFGSGRRICPALPLAHRMVHTMLASLLHAFEWKLPSGTRIEEIDMDEKFGLTLRKAKPLLARPIAKSNIF